MNFLMAINAKRFLFYAIALHIGIAGSFALFDTDNTKPLKNDKEKIIEIDISQPKSEAIKAETVNNLDIEDELSDITGLKRDFYTKNKLKEVELSEQKKELESLKNQSKQTKQKLISEKKKMQREKAALLKEKQKIEKEIQRLKKEAELKKKAKLKKEAEKKRLAEQKKLEDKRKKELAKKAEEERKQKLAKKKLAQKKQTTSDWLNSSAGKSAYYTYGSSIMNQIQHSWVRPNYAKTGWSCNMVVIQNENGYVQEIKNLDCNPNDLSFKNSVRQAVMKSSPLPLPSDRRLFDKKIKVNFSVE